MLSYLQKYSRLSPSLRQRFSSPEIIASIKHLEAVYGVNLGPFIIKTLVGEISANQGVMVLVSDFKLANDKAEVLMSQLDSKIFSLLRVFENQNPVKLIVEKELPTPSTNDDNLDKRLADIIKETKIDFASQELAERFKKIMYTHLKGIRDKIKAKEALVKPVVSGGLGFDLNSAENILRLVAKQTPNAEIKKPTSWIQEATSPIARDAEYSLEASIEARRQASESKVETVEEKEEKLLAPLTPAITEKVATAKPITAPIPKITQAKDVKDPKIVQTPKVESVPVVNRPVVENLRRTESGKIKMEDVMGSPKVFTPVDELKYMTIRNFRNLGKEPERVIEMIKKKIEALANEDYSKKIAGIQGWKVSPVNRMYIETYQEAINQGKSISFVLDKKAKANSEFINEAEFEAILKFNQDLKAMMH